MGATVKAKTVPAPVVLGSQRAQLWPVHCKPLPDELLSCWLVRLAHGHGLKAQTFCNLIFGKALQVWNRDIDRLGQDWLIRVLALHTGTRFAAVVNTTLRSYEGLLYSQFRSGGLLPWILALQMYHRKRAGYGLQFCPACLAADTVPYFRKYWRIASYTVCDRHGTRLLDRCPQCGTSVAVHRVDMELSNWDFELPLCFCHCCGLDLRAAPPVEASSYDIEASSLLYRVNSAVKTAGKRSYLKDVHLYSVMHHLCRTMTSRYKHAQLRQYVLDCLHVPEMRLTEGYMSFEMRPIEERHHLLQTVAWLLVDLRPRLTQAWSAKAIRYSLLVKDFPNRPMWYEKIVSELSNWRLR